MRIILKILAAPIVVVLTLFGAVFYYLGAIVMSVCIVVSTFFSLIGVFLLCVGDVNAGIGALVIGFLVSPFGLPAIAEWIMDRISDLNYSLRCFITD